MKITNQKHKAIVPPDVTRPAHVFAVDAYHVEQASYGKPLHELKPLPAGSGAVLHGDLLLIPGQAVARGPGQALPPGISLYLVLYAKYPAPVVWIHETSCGRFDSDERLKYLLGMLLRMEVEDRFMWVSGLRSAITASEREDRL